MRGAYVVVDRVGVTLTEDLSEHHKDNVMQGISHEEFLKLKELNNSQLKGILKDNGTLVFKYLGYTHTSGEMFNETVYVFKEERQEESQDNMFQFIGGILRRTFDTNYIVDWSD